MQGMITFLIIYILRFIHNEKPQSKFSFANRFKPVKCHVLLSHMCEKRYVQSGAAYHVFSRVSRTAS